MMDTPNSDQEAPKPAEIETASSNDAHKRHCFVVMPFGRDREEKKGFRGWYEVVIEPAVRSSGLEPVLSAAEEQPSAINDEIRSHLVFDPMVVVDLGGIRPDDPPNPNVMYELGIRHAFGLPLVIMAWEEQPLPFDVSNQRAIMTGRNLLDIEPAKQKLATFIRAAEEGRYYNPMEAVGREAALDATSLVLGEESLLRALTEEVRELRGTISTGRKVRRPRALTIKTAMGKEMKPELWPVAQAAGFDAVSWGKFLRERVDSDTEAEMRTWTPRQWRALISYHAVTMQMTNASTEAKKPKTSEEFIEEVARRLPEQPWPTGIHKKVAEELSVPPNQVSHAIKELIQRGRFRDQVDGAFIDPEETAETTLLSDQDDLNEQN